MYHHSKIDQLTKWIGLLFILLLPFLASANIENENTKKRLKVTLRKIGHELLTHAGDLNSRVLPINEVNDQYQIQFESELAFDPDLLMSISDSLFEASQLKVAFVVEVINRNTNEVAHSFIIDKITNKSWLTCTGRNLPKAPYSIHFNQTPPPPPTNSIEHSSWTANKLSIFLLGLLSLVLIIIYQFRKRSNNSRVPKNNIQIDENFIKIGTMQFNRKSGLLIEGEHSVQLSYKESELLYTLYSADFTPVTREQLLKNVWGDDGDYVGRTLDVFISKLRKKLEINESISITNVRGVGYKLDSFT